MEIRLMDSTENAHWGTPNEITEMSLYALEQGINPYPRLTMEESREFVELRYMPKSRPFTQQLRRTDLWCKAVNLDC